MGYLALFSRHFAHFVYYLVGERISFLTTMITKHFFKILILFTAMIILGLIGVFGVGYFGKESNNNKPDGQVAK